MRQAALGLAFRGNGYHRANRKMNSADFETKHTVAIADAIAPDGSEVRTLCRTPRGSMAQFTLAPGAVSQAVAHRTVEEIWYINKGHGRMWRHSPTGAAVVDLAPGVSLTIPVGTRFQFRCDGDEALEAVAVTMPPWPGPDEAYPVAGFWESTRRGDYWPAAAR
jgi:mannose-6-phosphate isomerase-like protein (cupin superfamily)